MPMVGIRGGQLEVFSKDQIHSLHLATLDILENTGVVMQDDDALTIMRQAGAYVDERSKVVRIPRYLVDESIKKAPSIVRLYGRDSDYDIALHERILYVMSAVNAIRIVDLNGTTRRAFFKDLEEITRLQDALENVHIMENPLISDFVDLPKEGTFRRCYETVLKNTRKHVLTQAEGAADVRSQVQMACAVMDWGDIEEFRKKPIFSIVADMAPPLKWGQTTTEVLLESARLGVPLVVESDPSCGATAPVTLAGTLIQQNAEILSGIVLSQLVNPGNPVMYLTGSNVLDPRTTMAAMAAPECRLYYAGTAQLCQYYHLPSMGSTLCTESKMPDVQSGYEKGMGFLFGALIGLNLEQGAFGMLNTLLTVCYAQSVVDNEIVGIVRHITEKNDISDKSIREAVEVINKVGPLGHYLSQKHTLENIASEFMPQISDRRAWGTWDKHGREGAIDFARQKARKILGEHRLESLPSDVEEKIHRIATN